MFAMRSSTTLVPLRRTRDGHRTIFGIVGRYLLFGVVVSKTTSGTNNRVNNDVWSDFRSVVAAMGSVSCRFKFNDHLPIKNTDRSSAWRISAFSRR